jgi:hypothetical protein
MGEWVNYFLARFNEWKEGRNQQKQEQNSFTRIMEYGGKYCPQYRTHIKKGWTAISPVGTTLTTEKYIIKHCMHDTLEGARAALQKYAPWEALTGEKPKFRRVE